MNLKSNGYHYDDCDDYKKEKEHRPTILKCSCPGGSISVPTTPTTPVVLATVPVKIPKLCNPCVNIEYSSTIGLIAVSEGATVNITVTVFKNCPNNFRISIGSYSYSSTGLTLGSTDAFSFFVCDCNTCQSNECCYYSAEITSSSVIGTIATLNNATLSAIIASSGCGC